MLPTTASPDRGAAGTHLHRHFASSLAGDVVAKIGVSALMLLGARELGPAAFAVFATLAAISLLASSLWDAGISSLILREGSVRGGFSWRDVRTVARLRLATFPIWLVAISVSVAVANRSSAIQTWQPVVLFGLASMASATSLVAISLLRSNLRFGRAALAIAAGRWASVFAIVATIVVDTKAGRDVEVFAAAVLFGEIICLAIAGLFCISLLRSTGQAPSGLNLRAALPYAANTLITVGVNRYDVLLLAALSSVAQVAFYAPATRLQDAVAMFPATIGVVAIPTLTVYWRNADRAGMRRMVGLISIVGVGLAVLVAAATTALAPQILFLVFGPGYGQAVAPLRVLIWFLPFTAVSTPLLSALIAAGGAVDVTKALVATFITAAVSHVLLDPELGAVGAAWASLAREPVLLFGLLFFLARRTRRAAQTC